MKTLQSVGKAARLLLAAALVLAVAVAAAPMHLLAGADEQQPIAQSEPVFLPEYAEKTTLVAENQRFSMYIEESQFNIAIVDKKTGQIWYTSPPQAKTMEDDKLSGIGRQMAASHLIVSYINTKSRTTGSVNSILGSVRQKTASYKTIEHGVRIVYDFSRASDSFEIPVELVLTEKGVDARVDLKNIREYGQCLVSEITLLPYFAAAQKGEQGYILVPDGSGSIIRFDSAKSSTLQYSQPVYGRDEAFSIIQRDSPVTPVHLPVFGMSRENGGFVAIIDSGAAVATINAMASGTGSEFNYAYASFSYRGIDNAVLADASWISKNVVLFSNKHTELDKVGVSYRFLDDNTIVGMAEEYRSYLMDKYGLKALENPEVALYTEFYGGVQKKKSFFGIILNTVVPMTKFSEAREILEELKALGADRMVVKYNGVLKGGMDNAAVINTKLEGKLGGNKGFKELADYASQNGISLYPDFEFQTIYKSRFWWWPFNYSAKMLSQSPATYFRFKPSTFFRDTSKPVAYLMSPARLTREIELFAKRYSLENIPGISTGSLGSLLYSDFNFSRFYDRQMSADNISHNLDVLSQKGLRLMVNSGFDYTAVRAEHIFDAPMLDSMFDLCEMRVPFYSIVFHGYKNMASQPINMTENPWSMFLSCIEQGVNPAFTLTYQSGTLLDNTAYNYLISTDYRRWIETAAQYYREFREVFGDTAGEPITAYEILSDDVRAVTYANGLVVCVNYSDEPYVYNGKTVEAESYAVIAEPAA